jgi:D-alanine-D-alanine ligase-like ATP-grasp enzyme
MIQITRNNYLKFSKTTQYICEESFERGWTVEQVDESSITLKLTNTEGKSILIIGATPPSSNYLAHYIVKDKYLTYKYLDGVFPMPETVWTKGFEAASKAADIMWAKGYQLVVKPADGAHGGGVSVNVTNTHELEKAWKVAKSKSPKTIIQQQLSGLVDTRITVIDGAMVGALVRYPATVVGDGKSSLIELILAENQNDKRGVNYSKELNIIDVEGAKRFLGGDVSRVPLSSEVVQVVGTANVGTGGSTKDITDDLPEWLISMCLDVAAKLGMKVAALDVMMSSEPIVSDEETELKVFLLEVNRSPALSLHEHPNIGKPRRVVKSFVDHLEDCYEQSIIR